MKSWVRFVAIVLLSLSIVLGSRQYVIAQTTPSQLVRQAQKQYQLGKSVRSLLLLTQAERIYQSQGAILPQAQVLALTSLAQQQQGNWDLARANLDRSFALIKQIPHSSSKIQVQAQVWNSQGHYSFATGQYRQALTDWQQAEKLYRQVSDAPGIAGTQLDRAEALNKMGFHRRACDRILTVLDPTQQRCQDLQKSAIGTLIKKAQTDSAPWLVASLNSMGNSLLSMGKLDFAKTFIQASRAGSLKSFDPNIQAKITLSLGNINQAIAFLAKENGDLASFRTHRRQALKYFHKLEADTSQTYKLAGQLNQLSILIVSQKWSQAIKLANKIQLSSQNEHDLYARVKFANSLVSLQRQNLALNYTPQDIAEMYLDVISQAKLSGDRFVESSAWGNLGKMADERLNLEYTPQQLLEQALILAQANHSPEMAYRWQWQLGRIYRQQGLRDKAIASYQAALANLSSLRSDLVALEKEVQYEFKEQIEPVYRELADLLLTDNPRDDDKDAARNVIEALQIAELDNYFQDACLTFEPKRIDSIDRDAALIYTIILPDRLEIIMANSKDNRQVFHHYSTNIAQKQLEKEIQQLRLYLTEPDRTREVQQLSVQIYSWLIQPLMADLTVQQPKTLVFVLDGMLQTIPMSALYDGKQYLIEKYAIALTPGLRLLNPQQDPRPLSFLAGGISRYLQVDNWSFAALTNVADEIETARQQEYPPLLNQEFTPKNLVEQLSLTSASVLHLATHGQFRANPQQTFLLMWQQLLTIKEFSSILQNRSEAYRHPIKLLVLSACDTAAGDRRSALGLAGIAVRSGALSTLATLWQINDESTTELMKHFYQHLNHTSKAEALRLAQLELWSTVDKDWQVPAFWSAYVIIGNWQ